MTTTAAQYAIVSFIVLSLIISIFYADTLQKSNRKHMLAGCFILLATFVYTLMIILQLKTI